MEARYEPEQISVMDLNELLVARANVIGALASIRGQIAASRAAGDIDYEWRKRAVAAIGNMERSLSLMKARYVDLTGSAVIPSTTPGGKNALDAIQDLRNIVVAALRLYDSAKTLVEDDTDAHWAALEDALASWPK